MSPQAQLLLTGGIEVAIGLLLAWCVFLVWKRQTSRKDVAATANIVDRDPESAAQLDLIDELTRLISEHAVSVEAFRKSIERVAPTSNSMDGEPDAIDAQVVEMRRANHRFDAGADRHTQELKLAVHRQPKAFATVSSSFGTHRQRTSVFDQVLERLPAGGTATQVQRVTLDSLRDVLETKQRLESELTAAQKQIEEQAVKLRAAERDARIDQLTRLPNRRAFDEHLQSVHGMFERNGLTYSLLELDVDKFKSINDTYGHAAGDAVLQVMGKVLQTQLRLSDKVFRLGGEEFVMVLSATNAQQAIIVAERLRKRIESSAVHFERYELNFTASIGVAEIEAGQTTSELMERTDEALYAAKESGRNRVEVAPRLDSATRQVASDACV